MVPGFFGLILFSIMFSIISSFLRAECYPNVHMHCIFSAPSSVVGHFGCLHALATLSNAAVNVGVYISLRIRVVELFG